MTLDELRVELAGIDHEILEMVARRQAVAAKIGRAKQAEGISTRDFRQEKTVLERARAAASALGLRPDHAEELLLLLIRSSLAVQEQDRVAAQGGGDGRRVLVIGGSGKMGAWFVRFLASQGFEVEVADPTGPLPGHRYYAEWERAELDQDLIVVATPLRICNDILLGIAQRKPRGVVFDIGSLKSPLRDGLTAIARAGVRATSVHPMFGPDTELLTGRHVILVDLGIREATEMAGSLFASTMAVRIEMNLESHDRLIAYILGLSHAVNIAFFTALANSGEAAPKLAGLSSTTFEAQLEVARRIADENASLYYEIQALNDYGTESLAALLYAVERLRSVIRAGDEAAFAELMAQGQAYLAGR